MSQSVLDHITDTLVHELKAHGIDLLYYGAYGTKSRYLKMDDGMLHSIRISDHPGKQHLKYRYEIGPHISQQHCVMKQGFPCHKYPADVINQLLTDILKERDTRLRTYGPAKYAYYRQKSVEENRNKKGFWSKARHI